MRSTSKNVGLYFRGIGNDEDNVKEAGYYQETFGAFGIPFNIDPLNFQKINLFRDLS